MLAAACHCHVADLLVSLALILLKNIWEVLSSHLQCRLPQMQTSPTACLQCRLPQMQTSPTACHMLPTLYLLKLLDHLSARLNSPTLSGIASRMKAATMYRLIPEVIGPWRSTVASLKSPRLEFPSTVYRIQQKCQLRTPHEIHNGTASKRPAHLTWAHCQAYAAGRSVLHG